MNYKAIKLSIIITCVLCFLLINTSIGKTPTYIFSSGTEKEPFWEAVITLGTGRERVKLFKDSDNKLHLFLPSGADAAAPDFNRAIEIHQGDNIPSIFITSETPYLDFTEDKSVEDYIELREYSPQGNLKDYYYARLKGHGNGSWDNNSKKSWSIFFDNDTSFLGLKPGRKYVAIANAQDQTHLRNAATFQLAEHLHLPYTPGYVFVDMYFNGDYLGLYQMTERVEAGTDRVNVDVSNVPDGVKKSLKSFESEDMKGFKYPEGYEPDVSTGFILREEEGIPRYESVDNGYMEDESFFFEIVSPRYASKAQIEELKLYLEMLNRAIASENGMVETQAGTFHYSDIIDVSSFASKYLVEQISKNHDGNICSSYYFIPKLPIFPEDYEIFGPENKIYEGPVWDYDIAYGNVTWNSMWQIPEGVEKIRPGLDKRPEFMGLVQEIYKSDLMDYMEKEWPAWIQEAYLTTKDSAAMDNIRWKDNPLWFFDGQEDAVRDMLGFISLRNAYLQDVWVNNAVYYRINFVYDDRLVHTVYLKKGESIEQSLLRKPMPKEYLAMTSYREDMETPIDLSLIPDDSMTFWLK